MESKSIHLEAPDEAVLRYLLNHSIADRYEMWKTLKGIFKSYSSIFNATKKLQTANLIKIEHSKPSKRNPKIEVEQYQLTLTGLILACSTLLDWSKINEVIKSHREDLPLIFGKWNHFIEQSKEKYAIQKLHTAMDLQTIQLFLRTRDYRIVEEEGTKKWAKEMREAGYDPFFYDNEHQVTKDFFMLDYVEPPKPPDMVETVKQKEKRLKKENDEWQAVCLKDPEIKAFCEPLAKRNTKIHKDFVKYYQKWIS